MVIQNTVRSGVQNPIYPNIKICGLDTLCFDGENSWPLQCWEEAGFWQAFYQIFKKRFLGTWKYPTVETNFQVAPSERQKCFEKHTSAAGVAATFLFAFLYFSPTSRQIREDDVALLNSKLFRPQCGWRRVAQLHTFFFTTFYCSSMFWSTIQRFAERYERLIL